MQQENLYDVAIIGGGPAGLTAGSALDIPSLSVHLYEQGNTHRNRSHQDQKDLGIGIGGAGLFSDGKFSFYPSATNLYQLSEQNILKSAYERTINLLKRHDIQTVPFPEQEIQGINKNKLWADQSGECSKAPLLKEYPSFYASMKQRSDLLDNLTQYSHLRLLLKHRVEQINILDEGKYEIVSQTPGNEIMRHRYRSVILATGKFGSYWLSNVCNGIPWRPLRYEIGIRIEFDKRGEFLRNQKPADVKYMWNNANSEIRTFCTCRGGEVWNVDYGNISSISGRADGTETNYNNFALLARFADNRLLDGRNAWRSIQNIMSMNCVIWQEISEFQSDMLNKNLEIESRPWFPKCDFKHDKISRWCNGDLYNILQEGVREFVELYPDLLSLDTICLFPAIEGVGFYPDLDESLKIIGKNIYCIGDIAGSFRGIVAAMVSGYYVGEVVRNNHTL